MKTLAEYSRQGAYDFKRITKVLVSRRGIYYLEIGGFRWQGNQGGYDEYRYKISQEDAGMLIEAIDAANSGTDGLATDNLQRLERDILVKQAESLM